MCIQIREMHCTGLLIKTTGLDCRFSNYVTVIKIGSYSWSTDFISLSNVIGEENRRKLLHKQYPFVPTFMNKMCS